MNKNILSCENTEWFTRLILHPHFEQIFRQLTGLGVGGHQCDKILFRILLILCKSLTVIARSHVQQPTFCNYQVLFCCWSFVSLFVLTYCYWIDNNFIFKAVQVYTLGKEYTCPHIQLFKILFKWCKTNPQNNNFSQEKKKRFARQFTKWGKRM